VTGGTAEKKYFITLLYTLFGQRTNCTTDQLSDLLQQHSSRTAHQEAMHGTPAEQVCKPGRRTSSQRSSGVCGTPQECATMMDAVEQAMAHAQYAPECTPGGCGFASDCTQLPWCCSCAMSLHRLCLAQQASVMAVCLHHTTQQLPQGLGLMGPSSL